MAAAMAGVGARIAILALPGAAASTRRASKWQEGVREALAYEHEGCDVLPRAVG
jgi:molybdopterin biosynthesis enzyme MoaB